MSLNEIYDPKVIFDRLVNGEKLSTISNFYRCSESELMEAVRNHFGWESNINVLHIAKKRNKVTGKQISKSAIAKRIEEWRKMYPKMTKEEFKERLKQSGRSYTDETLAIVDVEWDDFAPKKDENLRDM